MSLREFPLELSHWHLPETFFSGPLQKARRVNGHYEISHIYYKFRIIRCPLSTLILSSPPWVMHQPVGLMMAGITTGMELTIYKRKT